MRGTIAPENQGRLDQSHTSRNDIVSNVSVFVAAGAVWLAESRWPDLIVGSLLAILLLRSAIRVMRDAMRALADAEKHPAAG